MENKEHKHDPELTTSAVIFGTVVILTIGFLCVLGIVGIVYHIVTGTPFAV